MLITKYVESKESLFNLDNSCKIVATIDSSRTIGLNLSKEIYNDILKNKPDNYQITLPFFGSEINLFLENFSVYEDNINIISSTASGDKVLSIKPNILSYKLILDEKEIGVFVFVNNSIKATFNLRNKQYEITEYNDKYILFEATNSINQSNFSCAVSDETTNHFPHSPSQLPSTPVCVELAVDIDYYTRQTFSSDQDATDWAAAIIAGVSQVYESETNAAIQLSHIYIWNTNDPYSAFTGQPSSMLSELRNYWSSNNPTPNNSTDLVHLMTKRTNTGTGGIAYVDVLCDYGTGNDFGYGFSANLTNDTTFNFPNPTYSWNLSVVSHEIGHNFGAKHTHWCGWLADPALGFNPPGGSGVIDNCVSVEGSCPNNISSQVGTIMSYCHTNGSVIIDFHPIVVSQKLDPGIANASCLTTCDYYGCTDTAAFNYDPTATQDDGSCIPKIYGCIDGGTTDYTNVPGDGPDGVIAANYDPAANTDDGSCTYCAALSFNVTDISCLGANDGAIYVNVSNSSGTTFVYDWIGPNGFTAILNSNVITNIGLEGTYIVTVTDDLGCSDSSSVFINEPDPLTILNVNVTDVNCNGGNDGTVSINVLGGTGPYSFDYGGNNPNQLSAGNYNVIISDVNNCPSVSTNFNINEPLTISGNPIISDISCYNFQDGYILLSMSGGTSPYSFLWSGPNGFSSISEDILGLSEGNYSLDIIDANGCVLNQSFFINNPIMIDTSSSTLNNISCFGGNNGSITLNPTGGTPPYNYSWSNGATTLTASNLVAGQYYLTISDANGCPSPTFGPLILSEPLPSNMTSAVSNVDCSGNSNGSISITYTPASNNVTTSFSWTGPNGFISSSQNIFNLSSGVYDLTVQEDSFCLNTFLLTVNEPDPLNVDEQINGVSCLNGSDGSVFLSIYGGTPTFSTSWAGNVNPLSLSAGTYSYTVVDTNGCTYSDFVSITQPSSSINVIDSVTNVSCFNGSNGTGQLYISGGLPPYIYSWPNSNPNALPAGFNIYEVLDANNCLYIDSVFIDQPLPISVTELVNNILCYGASTGSIALQVSGGTIPYNYFWSNSDTNQIASNLSAGNYIYNVTDYNGCQFQGVASVSQSTSISVQTTVSPSSCVYSSDGSVNVLVNGGLPPYTYNWGGANPMGLSPGQYTFQVIDTYGCIDTNQFFVNSLSDIQTSVQTNDVLCYGESTGNVSVTITNGINPYLVDYFELNNNSPVSSSVLSSGDYLYRVTDALGCIYEDTFSIFEPQDLSLQIISQQNNLLEASASGGIQPYSFVWWDNSGTLSNTSDLYVTNPGTYYCVVIDKNNCTSDTLFYIVEDVTSILEDIGDINIYPNPTRDFFYISSLLKNNDIIFNMIDALGKKLKMQYLISDDTYFVDCSEYAAGVYTLSIQTPKNTYFKKIVIK